MGCQAKYKVKEYCFHFIKVLSSFKQIGLSHAVPDPRSYSVALKKSLDFGLVWVSVNKLSGENGPETKSSQTKTAHPKTAHMQKRPIRKRPRCKKRPIPKWPKNKVVPSILLTFILGSAYFHPPPGNKNLLISRRGMEISIFLFFFTFNNL